MSYIYNDSILVPKTIYKVQDILKAGKDAKRFKNCNALFTQVINDQASVRITNNMHSLPVRCLINVKGYVAKPVRAENADGFAVVMQNTIGIPVGRAYLGPTRVTSDRAYFDINGSEISIPLNLTCCLVKIKEKVTKEAKKVEKETGISHELVNLLDDKSARKEPEDPLPIFVRKLFPNLIVEEVREKIRKEHRPVYDMDGNDHNTIAEAERANVLIKQRILTQHVKIMVDMEYNRQEAEALKKG